MKADTAETVKKALPGTLGELMQATKLASGAIYRALRTLGAKRSRGTKKTGLRGRPGKVYSL